MFTKCRRKKHLICMATNDVMFIKIKSMNLKTLMI